MSLAGTTDPRWNRSINDTKGLARRLSEMERRLARVEKITGPPGRRVYWIEKSGPWTNASPPVTGVVSVTIEVPGVYLVAVQFTAFTTTVGNMTKELWVDGALANSTAQTLSTANEHTTIAMEAAFVELAAGAHTFAIRWDGTGATSDGNDRASFYAWRTS